MQIKLNRALTKKEQERLEELQMLARAGEVMIGEHEEAEAKHKGRKEVFRRAWLEQMDIKRQEKQINDELLRVKQE